MVRPVFLLLIEDEARPDGFEGDLRRRFDRDYQVIGATSARTALGTLSELADSRIEVALLIADQRLREMAAVDFLARAHDLHPAAKRVLLVERGDWSARHPAVSAMTLGKIDYHLWGEPRYPELLLYPAVSDFLAQWEKSREPSFAAVRVVGTPNSASVHQLREALSRGGAPYWFLDADSDEGRSLLRDVGAEAGRRRRARRTWLHPDRSGRGSGRPAARRLASHASTAAARNEHARCLGSR